MQGLPNYNEDWLSCDRCGQFLHCSWVGVDFAFPLGSLSYCPWSENGFDRLFLPSVRSRTVIRIQCCNSAHELPSPAFWHFYFRPKSLSTDNNYTKILTNTFYGGKWEVLTLYSSRHPPTLMCPPSRLRLHTQWNFVWCHRWILFWYRGLTLPQRTWKSVTLLTHRW